jgi:hypothetical protein
VRLGERARILGDYLRAHRDTLAAMPGFLFAVGHCGTLNADDYVERVALSTGWQPTGHASFTEDPDLPRAAVVDLAQRIADEIPSAVMEPSLL